MCANNVSECVCALILASCVFLFLHSYDTSVGQEDVSGGPVLTVCGSCTE